MVAATRPAPIPSRTTRDILFPLNADVPMPSARVGHPIRRSDHRASRTAPQPGASSGALEQRQVALQLIRGHLHTVFVPLGALDLDQTAVDVLPERRQQQL